MKRESQKGIVASEFFLNILGGIFWLIILITVLSFFIKVFFPENYRSRLESSLKYDRDVLKSHMSPDKVEERLFKLLDSNRSPGSEGHRKISSWWKTTFSSHGMEVLEQNVKTVHPISLERELLIEGKKHQVWPLLPNHLQPMNTFENGLTGYLYLVNDHSIKNLNDPTDKIAVLDLSAPRPNGLGFSASRYANLGFKALIVTHKGGINEIKARDVKNLNLSLPINFVRVFAKPEVLNWNGKKSTLKVKTKFKEVSVKNMMAVMRPKSRTNSEAILIPVTLDGLSYFPDLIMGSREVMNTVIQERLMAMLAEFEPELKRDVIFIAIGSNYNAQAGLNEFLKATGRHGMFLEQKKELEIASLDNEKQKNIINQLQEYFKVKGFAKDIGVTSDVLKAMTSEESKVFKDQLTYILKVRVKDLSEKLLQAKINLDESTSNSLDSNEYISYKNAKMQYDKANSYLSYDFDKILSLNLSISEEIGKSLESRLDHLAKHHFEKNIRYKQDIEINNIFSKYKNIIINQPQLNASSLNNKEMLSFSCGHEIESAQQAENFHRLLNEAIQRNQLNTKVGTLNKGKRQGKIIHNQLKAHPLQSQLWSRLSFPAASWVNPNTDYDLFASPKRESLSLYSIKHSLLLLGEVTLSMAYGKGSFKNCKYVPLNNFNGTVFQSDIGNSIVPNFPLEKAIVIDYVKNDQDYYLINRNKSSSFQKLLIATDPYGKYHQPLCAATFAIKKYHEVSPEAAAYNEKGIIIAYKDNGHSAQKVFKSISIQGEKTNSPINLILFRASPVCILDRTNPQTLKNFSAASFIRQKGLSSFEKYNNIVQENGFLSFIEPHQRFYVCLKDGSLENNLVQETRAFILNTPYNYKGSGENEIEGLGYLARDTPIIYNIPNEIARSMFFLNNKRIKVQEKSGMVDEMTQSFHERAGESIEVLKKESMPLKDKHQVGATSVRYSILNYPIVKGSITEAIIGVLWYMGLLIPFVFFFEKLFFAYSDIRKSILVQVIIFVSVFLILQLLHPAFGMIRSSVMILLGFVIMIISMGITFVLSGKFKENINALREAQGQVNGVNDNKTGIIMTAFMLGLNNMNRRKVRTGLTCATLVLLTFVMICFTSINSNIVESVTAHGKSPYTGFLIKEKGFLQIGESQYRALQSRYGDRYEVIDRKAYVGEKDYQTESLSNPLVEILSNDSNMQQLLKGVLLFSHNDPLAQKLPLIAGEWFNEGSKENGVIISQKSAKQLGISINDFKPGIEVKINGTKCYVLGIYEQKYLEELRDNDGDNLLPFDADGMIDHHKIINGALVAEPDAPRMLGSDVIIARSGLFTVPISAAGKPLSPRRVSVVVSLEGESYKDSRKTIDQYLEQSGNKLSYGLFGTAYIGQKIRSNSLSGMIDLLIPLFIAGLTVLNTMKGSVYERREEIYIYNAIGIAPRYIFFMFIAEAFVYAVIGSMLGYILSQGTGRLLIALDFTGGINMNFTSLNTVYASLTIAAAVFLSTWFPARAAMEIASPSEKPRWSLKCQGDSSEFYLPFTFNHYDRIAVLAFFYRYLENHGEGSAGQFFAGKPSLGLVETDENDPNYVPMITASIWLKPFDLGVSQQMNIELQTDEETGEYVSKIVLKRLSGSRESWERVNQSFVQQIRKHFLHWRAVTDDLKEELHAEAKTLLEQQVAGAATHG